MFANSGLDPQNAGREVLTGSQRSQQGLLDGDRRAQSGMWQAHTNYDVRHFAPDKLHVWLYLSQYSSGQRCYGERSQYRNAAYFRGAFSDLHLYLSADSFQSVRGLVSS